MGSVGKYTEGKYVEFGSTGNENIGNVSPNKAIVSNSNGKIVSSSVTVAEIESLLGAKGNIQNQIDNISVEPPIYEGAVSTILGDDLEAGKVLISDENGKVSASAVTKTQLGYLDGLTGNVQEQINYLMENAGSGGTPLSAVTALEASGKRGSAELKWTDPEDVVFNGETLAQFDGTKVVRNTEHYPTSTDDGVVAVDSKVRNQYAETPFVDGNLENDTDYYYTLFPYTVKNIYTFSDKDKAMARPIGFDSVLANNTWAQISEASALGLASELWNLGDEKDGCAIIGFNHDDLTDGSGKAGITFVCNDNNKTISGQWNNLRNSMYFYANSLVRSNLEKIYSGEISTTTPLSAELRSEIKEVNKRCMSGDGVYENVSCHLFLLSRNTNEEEEYEGRDYISYGERFWSREKARSNDYYAYVIIDRSTKRDEIFINNRIYKYCFCI